VRIGSGVLLAMKTRSAGVWAHESSEIVTGKKKRRDPLSAVSPELQFEFQDSKITVTNWVRFVLNRRPTMYSNRRMVRRQPKIEKGQFKRLSADTWDEGETCR
jgi:hypothetical protein